MHDHIGNLLHCLPRLPPVDRQFTTWRRWGSSRAPVCACVVESKRRVCYGMDMMIIIAHSHCTDAHSCSTDLTGDVEDVRVVGVVVDVRDADVGEGVHLGPRTGAARDDGCHDVEVLRGRAGALAHRARPKGHGDAAEAAGLVPGRVHRQLRSAGGQPGEATARVGADEAAQEGVCVFFWGGGGGDN